jgi:hypothetical protein
MPAAGEPVSVHVTAEGKTASAVGARVVVPATGPSSGREEPGATPASAGSAAAPPRRGRSQPSAAPATAVSLPAPT